MQFKRPEYADTFKRIHQTYFPALKFFATRKIGDPEAAEMIVTDAFKKVFPKKMDLRDEVGIVKLLYHMIRNACIDLLRRKAAEKKRIDRFFRDMNHDPDAEEPAGDRDENEAELIRRLLIEVEKLPEKCRDTIQKLYFEGMSAKDLAKLRGIKVTSVHNLKNHALALLRGKLGGRENI
jgi:RNA polymerase sigma factor (sigma-70 family)